MEHCKVTPDITGSYLIRSAQGKLLGQEPYPADNLSPICAYGVWRQVAFPLQMLEKWLNQPSLVELTGKHGTPSYQGYLIPWGSAGSAQLRMRRISILMQP